MIVKKFVSFIWVFAKTAAEIIKDIALSLAVASLFVPLWSLRKMVQISTSLEHFNGADIAKIKQTSINLPRFNCLSSNGLKQYNRNVPANLQLSRPLNQIIADTFREEFAICSRRRNAKNVAHRNMPKINENKDGTLKETRDLQEEIVNAHREVISTFTQILESCEELKKRLMAGKRSDIQVENDEVRVLYLHHGLHEESTLYRTKKGFVVRFTLGPSLFGKNGQIYCNYPTGSRFKRDEYQQLPWKSEDDAAIFSSLKMMISGSYHYYLQLADKSIAASGYVLVDPELSFSPDEPLPLDCIQCQTVLVKHLGKFATWPSKLQVARKCGYNMIHFTPVQELGESQSSYSIRDQLKLNPNLTENKRTLTITELADFMQTMRKEWKMLSICDIVLNHTANDSPWLLAHPEVAYNCSNSPYMRPAYLLDAALYQFTKDVAKGSLALHGVPATINCEDHLNAMRNLLHNKVLSNLRLHELFICDVDKVADEFEAAIRNQIPTNQNGSHCDDLQVIVDSNYKRLSSTVDMEQAIKRYNVFRSDCFDEEKRVEKCTQEFKRKLKELNILLEKKLGQDLNIAVENIIAAIRYFRVQENGPRWTEISNEKPLFYRYFTDSGPTECYEQQEATMYGPNAKYLMAHNGWVMNDNPLDNFALTGTVYLRRELNVWSDSVKLNYGEQVDDNPFLWQRMKTYVEQTAQIFNGVRLDNCHSTPLHVAEYFLDCARLVRPDLYVIAELFTKSDHTDNVFVNRVGITSLVREALAEWNAQEEGRLVYRFGGAPVGAFHHPKLRPLTPTIAHALLFDQTHDNPSPMEMRTVYDFLPTSALMNMSCCASGSTRGYDELVPHQIHVVNEAREYTAWGSDESNPKYVHFAHGIIAAKALINKLHFNLGRLGFEQVYVDQMDADIVAVTRHHPGSHSSVILVAFTAFQQPSHDQLTSPRQIKPLRFEGVLDEIIFEAGIRETHVSHGFVKDNQYINGLRNFKVYTNEHIALEKSEFIVEEISDDIGVSQFGFRNFLPGCVVALKVSLKRSVQTAVKNLRHIIGTPQKDLQNILEQLNLADFNRILYRCEPEELDDGLSIACYHVPDHGVLVYAGLQGIMSLLSTIRRDNELGHPLCKNLREGNWLLEYIHRRLQLNRDTKRLGDWIEEQSQDIKKLPRYLVPSYFDAFITKVYTNVIDAAINKMGTFVQQGSTFVRALALGSIQFGACIKSAPLPHLSPQLGIEGKELTSLAAGLPHFATTYMRNWGRDTFIALRGLFILTGRHQEARYNILAYAACLRHGLIPNLLNAGLRARFNCRDAVWWWLHCIKSYVEEVPSGESILNDPVSRIFPTDDSEPMEAGVCDQPLHRVMQDALEIHFQGLSFRERNAGQDIDEHMNDNGFNNRIGVHPETGFVFGGNEHNCGTWMDKMGSSEKAGNKGVPATPRDGSAIELVGLSKAVITWLMKMHQMHSYPYNKVQRTNEDGTIITWTFKEWAEKIQTNFEKYFWVSIDGKAVGDINLVHRKGIYKDCYGATHPWTDFQLRCNFPIAMVIAPELFNAKNAWVGLENAEKYLLGPLGMKTLDPEDWNYRGEYDNANDSNDKAIAHGFNYHQGPEWLWPTGYYLRAKLYFGREVGKLSEAIEHVTAVLANHFVELQNSEWRGLPELTNANGAFCKDSSRTQAWSMSCILEVLYDVERFKVN